MKKNVAIVGGGLAGLIAGIELSTKGVPCTIFEKRKYPFHRVCGEYISNEALPYLKSRGLYPDKPNPVPIDTLTLSSVRGQSATMPLDLGGFGVSRAYFDQFLAQRATELGVKLIEEIEISAINFNSDRFELKTDQSLFEADVVIGGYGKRSKLDMLFDRPFTKKRSPYVGVKYHINSDHPDGIIGLHNFSGGYCGIVNVEGAKTNICYLVRRELVQKFKNLQSLEENVLSGNPALKHYIHAINRAANHPVVINEISFANKSPVENHVLMAGDAAGMITPLCGNGMAMAIHSGKLVAELVADFCSGRLNRRQMEIGYTKVWEENFRGRLRFGRTVQKLFGSSHVSEVAVGLLRYIKPVAKIVVRNTHGPVFH